MKLLLVFVYLFTLNASAKSMKVFSFNLHCALDNWEKRIDIMARYLGATRPDFIAFQEVCADKNLDMITSIETALVKYGYPVKTLRVQFTHMSFEKYKEHLMVVSRHASEASDQGFLPESPLQRGFLALKINGSWFINVHLEHRDDYAHHRRDQISFLVNRFNSSPHIIMGDFNSETHWHEQALFTQLNYKSVFPGLSRPSDRPNVAIDGFWISQSFYRNVFKSSGRLLFQEPHGDLYLSDHLAVELDLALNDKGRSF